MRIPHLHRRRSSLPRAGFPGTGALLGLGLLALGLAGCSDSDFSNTTRLPELEGGIATFDARGAVVDSAVSPTGRIGFEGASGNGGTVNITAGGTVDISSAAIDPLTFNVAAAIAALDLTTGTGLTVAPGQTLEVQGGLALSFLNVAAGGKLVLTDPTVISLTGDALIAGSVISKGRAGVIRQDGHDFGLTAAGSVVITGVIDCSGEHARELSESEQIPGTFDPDDTISFGGNGGNLNITATGGDLMVIGELLAHGGGSDARDPAKALSGTGGQVTLTTGGDLSFGGLAGARAGNSYLNMVTPGPQGGTIQFTAGGNVLMRRVTMFNVSGGRNSGSTGGNGGTVSIQASGAATLSGFNIDAGGGRLYHNGGTPGVGGSVTLTGSAVTMSAMTVVASGGDATEDADGSGGAAGQVNLGTALAPAPITSALSVAADVSVEVMGGDSLFVAGPGGAGGQLRLRGTATINFDGRGNVRGGNSFGGQEGTPGSVCVSGATPAPDDLAYLMSINNNGALLPCP